MKIIIRGTNWIGDAVMQIPALRLLRLAFPSAEITLNTRGWAIGVFQDADFIDKFLEIEPSESIFSQASKIQKGKFDLAIVFPNSFQSALIANIGKAKKRFGHANEGRSFLLTNPIKKPSWKDQRHEIYYYLNLIREVEKFYSIKNLKFEPNYIMPVSEERKEKARKILAENGVDSTRKTVAFCPGSTNSRAKRWQSGSYAQLNDKLQNELGVNVILIGDKSEFDVSREVAEKSSLKPIILTGKTNLAEATAILSICSLTISNDTGPAHISALLGTPTIVIFGPTNYKTTAPTGAKIMQKNVECAPCMLRDCPIDHKCMTLIQPEEVLKESKLLLIHE